MKESYHVRIASNQLTFCAAHFITYNGDVCEPLHGHNYHVAAEIFGSLDENQYVIDFVASRRALQEIVDKLDHRVLLPSEHPAIQVSECTSEYGDEIVATYKSRRWLFPRSDCVLLPIANTTAELLARYLAGELMKLLESDLNQRPAKILVSVDECDGQMGICELASD